MADSFLGKGWKLPINLDAMDRIRMVGDEADIREAILIILSTAKGERPMRPEFGCGIHDFVFGAINRSVIGLIETSIRDALTRWEPRIDLNGITVSQERLSDGVLLISIDYQVRQTNNRFNLVYPFYLTESA